MFKIPHRGLSTLENPTAGLWEGPLSFPPTIPYGVNLPENTGNHNFLSGGLVCSPHTTTRKAKGMLKLTSSEG